MSSTIAAKVNFSLPQLGRFSLSALGHAARAFWAADRFVADVHGRFGSRGSEGT